MNTLIPGSDRTPAISLQGNVFTITGRSYMENSVSFYAPVQKLIEEHEGPLNVEISLDFFNTSSSKCLMNLLQAVDKKVMAGYQCTIKWQYKTDDDDMRESAEEFRDMLRHVKIELESVDD